MTKGKSVTDEASEATDEASEADAQAPETEDAKAPEEVAPYEAKIVEPVEAAPEPEPEQETQPEVPDGYVLIRYVGPADTIEHGAYTFRGGQPVAVPSAVAEELLTYPFERFELVEEG